MAAETGSAEVKYLCTFAEDYNTCKHLDRNTQYCKNENTQCGFRKEIKLDVNKPVEKYVRQERWYEKYYK